MIYVVKRDEAAGSNGLKGTWKEQGFEGKGEAPTMKAIALVVKLSFRLTGPVLPLTLPATFRATSLQGLTAT